MQDLNMPLELQDLSEITGVRFFQLNRIISDGFSICVDCTYKSACNLYHSPNSILDTDTNIFICRAGYCYIYKTLPSDMQETYISMPIYCGYQEASQREQNTGIEEKRCLTMSPSKIIKISRVLQNLVHSEKNVLLKNIKNKLESCIENQDIKTAHEIMDHFFESIVRVHGLHINRIKKECIQMIFLLNEIENMVSNDQSNEMSEQWHQINNANTLGTLKESLMHAEKCFIKSCFESEFLKQNDAIQQAIQIIKQKYHEDISQNSVANSVYLSASHFSKTFKGITGVSFTKYLNNVRIEQAKRLLENPSIAIDRVHTSVGYKHRSYFGKVFLKQTGTTPKKYRDHFHQ